MITEDYVSFETAKLLKEKGFDARCPMIYTADGKMLYTDVKHHNMYAVTNKQLKYYTDIIAPTQTMAMKWLREVHNILLVVDYDYEFTSTSYIYKIYRLVENGRPERVIVKGTSYDKDNNPTEHIVAVRDYERSAEEYATYQQAAEAGIKYCLEMLVK